MRFDKFTTLAQEAVSAAQNLAVGATNPEITPLHLLSALVSEKGSNATTILQKAGVDAARVASLTEAELRRLPKVQGATTGNASRDLVEVLNAAERDAQKMKDAYVSTEHLLIALADVKSGAKEVL
ncbi:MAG: ATP-dependent chaperone ClpB, partial [Planctomycetota bacterium]|nr:ATP-dependent chaperone ClpB [Planctomycetota bacterium]